MIDLPEVSGLIFLVSLVVAVVSCDLDLSAIDVTTGVILEKGFESKYLIPF